MNGTEHALKKQAGLVSLKRTLNGTTWPDHRNDLILTKEKMNLVPSPSGPAGKQHGIPF